jgi:hypothetical protein
MSCFMPDDTNEELKSGISADPGTQSRKGMRQGRHRGFRRGRPDIDGAAA